MADVWLRSPDGYEVAVGSVIEAANLRAIGYIDVEEPKPSGGELTTETGTGGSPANTGEVPGGANKPGGETPATDTEQVPESSKPATRRR